MLRHSGGSRHTGYVRSLMRRARERRNRQRRKGKQRGQRDLSRRNRHANPLLVKRRYCLSTGVNWYFPERSIFIASSHAALSSRSKPRTSSIGVLTTHTSGGTP